MEKEGFIPLGQCGQGSYGKVMMGVSTNTHKPLAIKIVSCLILHKHEQLLKHLSPTIG